jgi:hypothetical protein
MRVAEELSKYKYTLDIVRVQEVSWVRGGIEPSGEYIFFYENATEYHEFWT